VVGGDGDKWIIRVVVGAFVLSRAAAYAAGIRFDARLLTAGVQIIDAGVLRDRLVESVWYLHSQPPLFNLFLGLATRISPFSVEWTFAPLWLALGAALVAVVHRLARALAMDTRVAAAVTVVVTANPVTILYENHLSYEYPLAVAIAALVLAALRWAETRRLVWLAAVAGLAGAAMLTRALLHPAWYVLVVGLALLARPPRQSWWPALAIVFVPLALAGAVIAKNEVLFGSPQLSSLTAWNVGRLTLDELPDDVREQHIREGLLTPLARHGSMLHLELYQPEAGPCTPAHPDVPAVAAARKTNGDVNLNAECYLALSGQTARNAIAIIPAEPAATARSVVGAFQIWAEPASEYFLLRENRDRIVGWETAYRRAVLLDVAYTPPVTTRAGWWIPFTDPGGGWRFSLTVAAGTLAALAAGIRSTARMARRRRWAGGHLAERSTAGIDAALAVIALTVAVTTVLGNFGEIGENNRFRFIVEPVTFVALAWLADRLARAGWRRWSGRGRSGAGPAEHRPVPVRPAIPVDIDPEPAVGTSIVA
jgi:hypothetical protein